MVTYEALNLVVQTNILLVAAITLLVTIIVHLNKKK